MLNGISNQFQGILDYKIKQIRRQTSYLKV